MKKVIDWTFKKIQSWYEKEEILVNFDMSSVKFTSGTKELIIDNENFEVLIAEYLRRKNETTGISLQELTNYLK